LAIRAQPKLIGWRIHFIRPKRDEIESSLACHAAIKVNKLLTAEKMRWLIDRLVQTSSPTTVTMGDR
jgi:DNA mismatch repair ATPase MutL